MDCDRIKFLIREIGAGYVVFEKRFSGTQLLSTKELGMVHHRKEDAFKAAHSLIALNRRTSPHASIDLEG
jgi:hypothetical protein